MWTWGGAFLLIRVRAGTTSPQGELGLSWYSGRGEVHPGLGAEKEAGRGGGGDTTTHRGGKFPQSRRTEHLSATDREGSRE